MPDLRFSFADSHIRQECGGWTRQVTEREPGIDPSSGRLQHLSATSLVCAMAYIVTDRRGRFLLCASYTDAKLAVYPINGAARVLSHATQIMPTGPNAHCIVLDAANRFAYSAVLGEDLVLELVFDVEAGVLSPTSPPSIATHKDAGPRHLTFHPGREFLYLLNQTDATVITYGIEAGTGRVTE
ncbi:MAG: beta-propeller fold lactonase family protein, partial [Acetobacteraceae bacterium]|nr:beta-propeller fold lactonase family protein [Acetobacteraceae bacterium]